MREIVFRGKSINNGQWTEGNMIKNEDATFIVKPMQNSLLDYCLDCPVPFDTDCMHQVIPETVGQYTGLVDKNGKRIFEGDIIQYDDSNDISNWCRGEKAVVFCLPGRFVARMSPFNEARFTNQNYINEDFSDVCEVIGNIYDNPELLGLIQINYHKESDK